MCVYHNIMTRSLNRSFETLLQCLLSLLTRPINNTGKNCIIRDFIFLYNNQICYPFLFSFFFSAGAASSPTGEFSLLLLVVVFQVFFLEPMKARVAG